MGQTEGNYNLWWSVLHYAT